MQRTYHHIKTNPGPGTTAVNSHPNIKQNILAHVGENKQCLSQHTK